MIDLNTKNTEGRALSTVLNELVDAGLVSAQKPPRPYLGASALGSEDDPWSACLRAVQLGYIHANGLPGAPEPCEGFSGRTLRIFDMGHALEARAAEWLRAAGFDLRTARPDGSQFGFAAVDGRFKGHIDGVILSGGGLACPALWEHKTMNAKKWQETVKKGVPVACPGYHAQISAYQAYLDLSEHPALFQATNKDTSELYFELVPFSSELAQRTSDRAAKILGATDTGELLPKAYNNADHFACKGCRWREFCWS